MHPIPPQHGTPMQVASHAERLAREQPGSRMGMVFQGITAISLGVMTAKSLLDMLRDRREKDKHGGHHR